MSDERATEFLRDLKSAMGRFISTPTIQELIEQRHNQELAGVMETLQSGDAIISDVETACILASHIHGQSTLYDSMFPLLDALVQAGITPAGLVSGEQTEQAEAIIRPHLSTPFKALQHVLTPAGEVAPAEIRAVAVGMQIANTYHQTGATEGHSLDMARKLATPNHYYNGHLIDLPYNITAADTNLPGETSAHATIQTVRTAAEESGLSHTLNEIRNALPEQKPPAPFFTNSR